MYMWIPGSVKTIVHIRAVLSLVVIAIAAVVLVGVVVVVVTPVVAEIKQVQYKEISSTFIIPVNVCVRVYLTHMCAVA